MEIKKIKVEDTWNLRHEVMWPDRDLDYIKLENDFDGIHYGLFVNDKMVSVISVFFEGKSVQFRKFATLKSEQNKGYGTFLLKGVFEEIEKTEGSESIWCNARKNKRSYYEKFGLKETGRSFEKGGKSYIIMRKHIDK